eukprot:2975082-Lingulodinium_polyedra.AAC.1
MGQLPALQIRAFAVAGQGGFKPLIEVAARAGFWQLGISPMTQLMQHLHVEPPDDASSIFKLAHHL